MGAPTDRFPFTVSSARRGERTTILSGAFLAFVGCDSGAAVVRAHGALFLDLPVALLFGIAFVVFLFAAGEADLDLDLVALPIHRGGHQGVRSEEHTSELQSPVHL